MEKFKVEFFVDDKGNIPAKEFLLSLEPKLRAKVFRDIDLLATNGYNLRERVCQEFCVNRFNKQHRIAA